MLRISRYFCLLILSWGSVQAGVIAPPYDFDWQPMSVADNGDRESLATYVYDVPDSASHAFKGVADVPYDALSIVAMMMDLAAMTDWVYKLKRIETLQGIEKPRDFYMEFSTVWPVKPRDVGLESYIEYDQRTGVIDMYSRASDQYFPPRRGYVRIPFLYSHWRLSPKSQGWTGVEFETFVDMGGSIPAWVVNTVSKSAPKRTFDGLRQQMRTGRYKINSVEELPFVPPGLEGYK